MKRHGGRRPDPWRTEARGGMRVTTYALVVTFAFLTAAMLGACAPLWRAVPWSVESTTGGAP